MHLFINALAATAGGGLTYIRNVIPKMDEIPGLFVTAAVTPALREELTRYSKVNCLELEVPVFRRFWHEQRTFPQVIRNSGADVLLSTGNFALRCSPVPQILLSRNSLYSSEDFYRDLWSRGEFRLWLDTHLRSVLAKKSIQWADATVAPSEAFASQLRNWTGAHVYAIHHGFDREAFTHDGSSLQPEAEAKLHAEQDSLKLLFVSHYNYYRNFETLFRALPLLRKRFPDRPVKVLLTCQLKPFQTAGAYRMGTAARLLRQLGVMDMVVELGPIPYSQLHRLYARADVYVSPAYTETFAHPLVEAMASGVPVVASDIPVHREICADAATYFERFDPEALCRSVSEVLQSREVRESLTGHGIERSRDFSWTTHVERILELSRSLIHSKIRVRSAA